MSRSQTAADSLASIEQLVFKEKLLTLEKFAQVLSEDYRNDERLRQIILNKVPKYGNDNAEVDKYAKRIVTEYTKELRKYKDNRGGAYEYAVLPPRSTCFRVRRSARRRTAGTRAIQSPTTDLRWREGIRQVRPRRSRSIASIDQTRPQNGTLFNIKFDPNVVKGERGLEILENCVKSYFEMYGQHIQINIADAETLRDAQKHPENYGNLMVRVAGYSAYFIELDHDVQENVISRTAHVSTGC